MRFLTKDYGQTWDQLIGQDEYSYNDKVNRSIGKSPFKMVYGLHPKGVLELKTLKYGSPSSSYAEDFSQSMREVHESIRNKLMENAYGLKTKDGCLKEGFIVLD